MSSDISIRQCLRETGAFFTATVLSCGPSQTFGSIKFIVDGSLLLRYRWKLIEINKDIHAITNEWHAFTGSPKIFLIAEKLNIAHTKVYDHIAEQYCIAKRDKILSKITVLKRSIRADAYAMIPLAGAHLSWRVAANYKKKSYSPMFACALAQMLEHSQNHASAFLFSKRLSKKNNYPTCNPDVGTAISVTTSTKSRTISIFYEVSMQIQETCNQIPAELEQRKSYFAKAVKNPTVILFHAKDDETGKVASDVIGSFYRQQGYNTLAATMGGYAGSPGVTTSEKSIYQDIEAIKNWVFDMGVREVGYHAFCLGCGAALQAAVGETSDKAKQLKTRFVVLDQPYTTIRAIGKNFAGTLGDQVCRASCPSGLEVELPGGLRTKTDGFDNIKKVSLLQGEDIPLLCFERSEDRWMRSKDRSGLYKNFARDLLHARYGGDENLIKRNLCSLPGDHGLSSIEIPLGSSNDDKAILQIGNLFLKQRLPALPAPVLEDVPQQPNEGKTDGVVDSWIFEDPPSPKSPNKTGMVWLRQL